MNGENMKEKTMVEKTKEDVKRTEKTILFY